MRVGKSGLPAQRRSNHFCKCRLLARMSPQRGRGAAGPAAAVAWHPRKQSLAASEGADAVRVLDYAVPPGAAAPRAQPFAPETRVVLQHEQQRQVGTLLCCNMFYMADPVLHAGGTSAGFICVAGN